MFTFCYRIHCHQFFSNIILLKTLFQNGRTPFDYAAEGVMKCTMASLAIGGAEGAHAQALRERYADAVFAQPTTEVMNANLQHLRNSVKGKDGGKGKGKGKGKNKGGNK